MEIQKIVERTQGKQQRILALQEELGAEEIAHSVGEGLATFVCSGRKKPVAIKLDPRVLELSDITLLEDLIMLAIKGAADKVDALLSERTEAMMTEIGLPPGFQLPG